jgi:hypothetical protein
VIVAGGASFTAAQARLIGMARTRGLIRVIAINDAIYPCWFADIGFASDATWWQFHGELARFEGLKLTIEQKTALPEWVFYLRNSGAHGFDRDRGSLRTGENGGYQSLHLAVHLGASKIILVGYDMHGPHWFGEHPRKIRKIEPNRDRLIRMFTSLANEASARNIAVLNASEQSALKAFQFVDLASELEKLGD